MTTPQYSINGSTYQDFTASMLSGSFRGQFELVYPQPTDVTWDGQPCGAFGLPTAVLRMTTVSAAGMAAWLACFAGANDLATPFWMDIWDPNAQALARMHGTLRRPRWGRMRLARNGAYAVYEGVEIVMTDCEAA